MAEVTEAARQRVQRLVENWDWTDPAILEDILALGEDAVPALIETLTPELLADAQEDDAANALVYYAAELLGELKRPAAIPVLAGLYPQIADDDDLVETVSDALLSLGPAAIAPLLKVVADDSLPSYPRIVASETAVNLAGHNLIRRAQLAAGLRPLLAEYMERPGTLSEEDRKIIATLSSNLADIADLPALPLILAAFDADRVGGAIHMGYGFPDIEIITREEVLDLYQEGGRDDFRSPDPFLEPYRTRWRNYQEEQEEEKKREAEGRLKLVDADMTGLPIVLGHKIGRNDPCWCGSGKKYKKCHLAQDEKEKVRL